MGRCTCHNAVLAAILAAIIAGVSRRDNADLLWITAVNLTPNPLSTLVERGFVGFAEHLGGGRLVVIDPDSSLYYFPASGDSVRLAANRG
jgi:hypothetical protein